MTALVDDFSKIAKEGGEIILSELHKKLELRTIKPIDAGGLAGGRNFNF
jgi:hypothetical protein